MSTLDEILENIDTTKLFKARKLASKKIGISLKELDTFRRFSNFLMLYAADSSYEENTLQNVWKDTGIKKMPSAIDRADRLAKLGKNHLNLRLLSKLAILDDWKNPESTNAQNAYKEIVQNAGKSTPSPTVDQILAEGKSLKISASNLPQIGAQPPSMPPTFFFNPSNTQNTTKKSQRVSASNPPQIGRQQSSIPTLFNTDNTTNSSYASIANTNSTSVGSGTPSAAALAGGLLVTAGAMTALGAGVAWLYNKYKPDNTMRMIYQDMKELRPPKPPRTAAFLNAKPQENIELLEIDTSQRL